MKTIRELQKEMRDTAAWLEEASRDLSDLQTSRETSGEQVNFQRLQALGERYPILNHCLKDKTSAFQQQYLTLLAGLLLAEPATPRTAGCFCRGSLQEAECGCPWRSSRWMPPP